MPNTKVAEHLVQSLWKGSNMQEIVQNIDKSDGKLLDSKVTEFEIELERLHSQIDNLKSHLLTHQILSMFWVLKIIVSLR